MLRKMTLSRILCGFPRFAAISRVHLWRGQLMNDFQKGVLTSFSFGFSICWRLKPQKKRTLKRPQTRIQFTDHAINSVANIREARKSPINRSKTIFA